ncbi:CAP domain-containing protein [Nannocystaceae bacterium ST9]
MSSRVLAPALLIATLSLVLACDGDEGDDEAEGGGDDGAEQLCVDTINDYRATLDLPALERWTDAEDCSNGEAKSDSESGMAHGAFGTCGESAQNECPGWPGPPEDLTVNCLAQMWAEGPGEPYSEHGHYINMSNPNYTKVACGFYETPDGSWWAVQNFQ